MKLILRRALPPVILMILGFTAYLNSLPNSFHFDDYDAIVENPAIRDLKHIPSYFTDTATWTMSVARDWRPVVSTTFALSYWLGGLNPVIFRLFNLFLHIGTAYFLYLILTDIARRDSAQLPGLSEAALAWLALFAASLFLVHTANSEVVNYIFARSTLLATFLYVVAFYCYIRGPFSGREEHSKLWHPLAIISFILAVGAKGPAITLPLTLIVFEIIFLNSSGQSSWKFYWAEPKRLRKYLPLAAMAFFYVVLRQIFAARLLRGFFAGQRITDSIFYLFTQFRAWVYYMGLYLWPDPLISDYHGFGLSTSLWDGKVLLSLALVLVILGMAWRLWRTAPIVSFFILWYFIVLLPEASIIPLSDPVNGYRPYPANLGFSIVFTIGLFYALSRWAKSKNGEIQWRRCAVAYTIIAVVILGSLTFATIKRNQDWQDEGTFWRDIIDKDPNNPRAYMNLGSYLQEVGKYQEAGEMFEKAVSIAPKNLFAALLRADFYAEIGKNAEALADFDRVLQHGVNIPHAYFDRAELYRKMGETDKALADYDAALRLRPLYTNAMYSMALLLAEKEETEKAKKLCQQINQIDFRDSRGYDCVGKLLLKSNRIEDALQVYQQGILHAENSYTLWYALGTVYQKLGRYKEAGGAFERASSLLKPASSEGTP